MKKALALTIVFAAVLVLLCGCFEQNVPSLGNVVILGDSFSTFEGHIPDGYPSWYKPNIDYANVRKVEQTWWHIVVSKKSLTCCLTPAIPAAPFATPATTARTALHFPSSQE